MRLSGGPNWQNMGWTLRKVGAFFAGVAFTFEDEWFEYEEQRFITIGMLGAAVVVMAHTEGEKEIRVISMRKATRHEQHLYYRAFQADWGE
jgi:uncharacterized DUF497 family protein